MLERIAAGELPTKHHLALRSAGGALRYEECVTREGFEGPYGILYHEHRPHDLEPCATSHEALPRTVASGAPLRRRHCRTQSLPLRGAPVDARVPLLVGDDVTVSVVRAETSDAVYFVNGDADELFFVRAGGAIHRSSYGDLSVSAGDYLLVPKGVPYRLVVESAPFDALLVECSSLGIPDRFRNVSGQLRMDAPYCHRDFRHPTFRGPLDEGIRELVVRRAGAHHGYRRRTPLLDVVGWDGSVYPVAFPILAFQPRVSSVHLPPTAHATFAAKGVLVCSFVPRPLDFHPDAVACPYPHASVDVDEVLYYVSGHFSSRTGVGAGSLTLHPRGVPHGPHPGRYEAGTVARSTSELAVMLDCSSPLTPTEFLVGIEDDAYERSLLEPPA